MAIYHCSVKIIGRNSGRSAVAAAAYRSGENLTNTYDGIEHDYTKKGWIEYKEIMLPNNAPREYSDRSTLWNAVEMAEKSKDAQLCREFELALPVEMTKEEQIEIIHKFVNDKLISQGMIVDIAIHNPPMTNDRHQPIDENGSVTNDPNRMSFINPHAHILATVRPLDVNGKWEKKSEVEYLCKRGEEEKGFTSSEYKLKKEEGWQKQYRYIVNGKKEWMTADEAKEIDLERVNRSPKTSQFGRKNSKVEYWNSKDRIIEWRKYWEQVVNDKFEELKSDVRIDSRSFIDQGRTEELPTIHMGPSATNMEKRAIRECAEGKPSIYIKHSDIGEFNNEIKRHNSFVREVLHKIMDTAKMAIEEIAKKLESIRALIIKKKTEKQLVEKEDRLLMTELYPEIERLNIFSQNTDKIYSANMKSEETISRLKEELNMCSSVQIKKKREISQLISSEEKKMADRKVYITRINRINGLSSENEYIERKKYLDGALLKHDTLELNKERISTQIDKLLNEYEEIEERIPLNIKDKVSERRMRIRPFIEKELMKDNENIIREIKSQINITDNLLEKNNNLSKSKIH